MLLLRYAVPEVCGAGWASIATAWALQSALGDQLSQPAEASTSGSAGVVLLDDPEAQKASHERHISSPPVRAALAT